MKLPGRFIPYLFLVLLVFISTRQIGDAQDLPLFIQGFDREIWISETTVSGTYDPTLIREIKLMVDDASYPVQLDDGQFFSQVRLNAGDNIVSAIGYTKDGREVRSNALKYNLRIPDQPNAVIELSVQDGKVLLTGQNSLPSETTGADIVRYEWEERQENPAKLTWPSKSDITTSITPPVIDGEYYVELTVIDVNGKKDRAGAVFIVEDGSVQKPEMLKYTPQWAEKAVVYGVMPNNIGMFGFQSVIEFLDELEELGVTALWLSPVQDSPTLGHGYDITDYFTVRENYGTEEDFRKLIEAAHARNMKVLMDVVPNHTAADHRYFQHTLDHFEDSPYFDFYERDFLGFQKYYFNWIDLPNLNYEHPEVERWMIEGMAYWVREFDIDGFRVDVAWGVRERKPEFWPKLSRELQRIKPDVLLIAEASARDEYYFTNGFDAAYDWTDELGHPAWENVFEVEGEIPLRLHAQLTNNAQGYHKDALIFRFLNNNDTDYRFITRYGPDLTRTAAALLLTLPGIPEIYTGQEVGAEFRPYHDNWPVARLDLHDLFPYYKRLIKARKEMPSLYSRHWLPLQSQPESAIYSYVRYAKNHEPVLVVLNFSGEPIQAKLEVPKRFWASFEERNHLELLSNKPELIEFSDGKIRIDLEPWEAKLILGHE